MLRVCNRCLARVLRGRGDEEVGRKLREELGLGEEPEVCDFCKNAYQTAESMIPEIIRRLSFYEHETFLVGTKLSKEQISGEEKLWEIFGVKNAVSLKKDINRMVGERIKEATRKRVDMRSPDVRVTVDVGRGEFFLEASPVYVYGRYVKRAEMPQTKWPCRYCKGKGCEACEYTGRQWRETVEYIIGDVLLGLFMGRETKMHAAGREDIDAFMLGNGRPFVIEIVDPKRRKVDLELAMEEVNAHGRGKVEVLCLKWSGKEEVRELKGGKYRKVYRVHVMCKGGVEGIERIGEVKEIRQRIPKRVLHRKGERGERRRRIYWVRVVKKEGNRAVLEMEVEHGTYVKEFVTGDEGRTRPSVSEILGRECYVERLEVLEVKGGREC